MSIHSGWVLPRYGRGGTELEFGTGVKTLHLTLISIDADYSRATLGQQHPWIPG